MAKKIKPIVGCVYSATGVSGESELSAQYLGGLLFLGGYSSVKLVAMHKEGKSDDTISSASVSSGKITLSNPYWPSPGPRDVEDGEHFKRNCEFASLADCHVIIVCVDALDTERCGKALCKLLPKKKMSDDTTPPVGIFTLQHGCKNHEKLSSALNGSEHMLLDGAIGFHVAKSPIDGVLRPFMPGSLVLERLSKEKAEFGSPFVNLLSTTDIPILFRKVLTPFTWGTMIFNAGITANALTGSSMEEHFRSRTNRLVFAQIIRECLSTFRAAAGYQANWAPDCSASFSLSLGVLEQILCLPNVLWVPVAWTLLKIAPGAGSPTQVCTLLSIYVGVSVNLHMSRNFLQINIRADFFFKLAN